MDAAEPQPPGPAQRRAAEEPWRLSEERLRLAAEAGQFGIYDADLEAGTLYGSPELLAILGLPTDTVLPPPGDVAVFVHPDDVEQVREGFRQALDPAGGGKAENDHRIVRPDGAVRWVHLKGQVHFAGEGAQRRPVRSNGIVVDITSRKETEQRLAAELDAMTRLQKLGTLFLRKGELGPVLGEIVEAAIAIAGADFGNIQLLDPRTGNLRILAYRGLPDWWLEYWRIAGKGKGSCGSALARGERVVVEDVECSPLFVGTPALDIQRRAGIRAVQSTPLLGRSGKRLGMFSTHYKAPHRPDERALRLLDLLARQAAEMIERAQTEAALRSSEACLRLATEAASMCAWPQRPSAGPRTRLQSSDADLRSFPRTCGRAASSPPRRMRGASPTTSVMLCCGGRTPIRPNFADGGVQTRLSSS
jgi:PAS domain S-box-containing protein